MPDNKTAQPLLDPQFLARLEQLDRLTQSMPAARGRRSLWRVLGFLDKLEPAGPSDLRQALRTFSLKCSGKGIVILLSDLMDKGGYEDALRYLIARQLDIYVIQIL